MDKEMAAARSTVLSRNSLRVSHCASLANQRCRYSQSTGVIKAPTTASLKRGTGGRSSFNGIVCTVFGNTGFVGRYVCNRLGKIGTQLILPYRGDPYDSLRLKLCGDLGQVLFHPFHLHDEESIRKSIKYSNVVVNLIGRDWETKNFKFDDVHVDGARTLARLCKEANVERFIHVSCLNANPSPVPRVTKGGSQYYRSKWEGECAVKEEFPDATIVRPADIYGQEDRLLNVYTHRWRRHARGVPLWNKGEMTEKQPIWAGDVAAGIAAIVKDPKTAGQTYQFVGPKRYKLSELVDWIARSQRHQAIAYGHRRLDLKYTPIFWIKVYVTEALATNTPMAFVHWEGIEKEHTTDVVAKGIPTLEDLGVYPMDMETRMPWEIKPLRAEAHYMEQLGEFDPPEPPKTVPLNS